VDYTLAMRIAVLADIHGNLLALEAVLADLDRDKPDLIVNLGDCASGPLWPRETLDRLATANALTVRGNHDRQVATLPPDTMGASDRFAYEELETHHLEQLRALPPVRWVAPDILAFHATPRRDDQYLLDEVVGGRLARAPLSSIEDRLDGTQARVILCGHSHRPDMLQLSNGTLVINPGSVGCPAYGDPNHPAHVMEAGSPHARYALLEVLPSGGVNVKFNAVTYQHELASQRAKTNGSPEWAHALRTGVMPSADR